MTIAIILIVGTILYSAGVLTGIYVGYSIKKELAVIKGRNGAPSEAGSKKILALAAKKTKLTNNDVEKLLKISGATATRYLVALEKQGVLVQHGKTSRNVFYTVA